MRESKTQALDEGNCGVARPEVLRDAKPEWLKEQGVVSLQESWIAYHDPGGAPRVAEWWKPESPTAGLGIENGTDRGS